jgi:WD40 repeat protein
MSCRSSSDCVLHEIPIHQDWLPPLFAPNDYRILFTGTDETGTGEPAIFLFDFDPQKPGNPITNLSISGLVNTAVWMPDGKILDICYDGISQAANRFCIIDPATGSVINGKLMAPNLKGYRLFGGLFWLSPSGSQVATTVFPENGTRDSMQELRLLDLDGRTGTKLAASLSIDHVSFSPSGPWLAYVTDDESKLEIADINTGMSIPVETNAVPWAISWVGWVR